MSQTDSCLEIENEFGLKIIGVRVEIKRNLAITGFRSAALLQYLIAKHF